MKGLISPNAARITDSFTEQQRRAQMAQQAAQETTAAASQQKHAETPGDRLDMAQSDAMRREEAVTLKAARLEQAATILQRRARMRAAEAALAEARARMRAAEAALVRLIQHVRHDQTVRISGALRAWRLRGKVNAILSISHRWMLPTQPDPDGKQLEAIKAFLVSSAGKRIELVWIDGGSMPQHQPEIGLIRSDEDKDDFDTMLSQVNMLYLGTTVLILFDFSYLSRFWTQFEAWLSMQFPTPSGLKSAVGTKNARYHIVCIQNAAAQAELYTKALTDQWANKTPQQAFDILSKPDVTVTNQSDKRDQLPKIKALDMRVQGAFQAVDAQLHQRVAVSAEAAARAKAELDAFERDKGVKADDDDPLRKAAAQMEREAAAARAAQESHALAIAHGMMPNKRSVRSAWMVVRPSWPAAWPAPRDVSAVLAVMCALLMGELTGLTSVAVAVYTLYAIVCDFVLALALFVAVTTVAFFGAQLAWWRWRATRWRANARWFVSSHGMLSFGLKVLAAVPRAFLLADLGELVQRWLAGLTKGIELKGKIREENSAQPETLEKLAAECASMFEEVSEQIRRTNKRPFRSFSSECLAVIEANRLLLGGLAQQHAAKTHRINADAVFERVNEYGHQ
eukprot:jgi/Chrpa1/14474/Chrysochromulina_OHIO_Genome00021942-RA